MGRRRGKRLKAPEEEEEEENILKLPSHITVDILSSLPVKTIAHCACVCKAWRALLSDPSARFPQIHLSKSPVSLMLLSPHRHCWLIEFDKDFRKRKMSEFRYEHVVSGFQDMDVVGSCNGLICLKAGNALYVWNPVTNNHITLPLPNLKPMYCRAVEFGFCPRTNVYKVIRMVKASIATLTSNKAMCEVCTLGTNACWRTIEDVPDPAAARYTNYYKNNRKMPLNGAVHWFCSFIINDEKFPLWICAFGIQDEKWDPILLPLNLLQGLDFGPNPLIPWWQCLQVGVLENCLAIFDHSQHSLLNIWMMKEYGVRESWTKCWSISSQIPTWDHVTPLLPLKLTRDGELLMFDNCNTTLVCFDPLKRLVTRKQRIYGVRGARWLRGMAYVASFTSPTQVMNEELMLDYG